MAGQTKRSLTDWLVWLLLLAYAVGNVICIILALLKGRRAGVTDLLIYFSYLGPLLVGLGVILHAAPKVGGRAAAAVVGLFMLLYIWVLMVWTDLFRLY